MTLLINSVASIICCLAVFLYIQLFLEHNMGVKELWVIFTVGLLGMFFVALVTAILLGTIVTQYHFIKPFLFSVLWSLLGIAVPQISTRILLIKKFCMRRSPFVHLINGIVYGIVISLGFGIIDSFFYARNIGILAVFYGIGSVLCHSMIGATVGYHLAKNRLNKYTLNKHIIMIWLLPIGLHFLYIFPSYLINAVYASGSFLWVPMYIVIRAISLVALWILFILTRSYLNDAPVAQGDLD